MSTWLNYSKSKEQEKGTGRSQISPTKSTMSTPTPIDIKLVKLAGATPSAEPTSAPAPIREKLVKEVCSTKENAKKDVSPIKITFSKDIQQSSTIPAATTKNTITEPLPSHLESETSNEIVSGRVENVELQQPKVESEEPLPQEAPQNPRAVWNRDLFRRYFTGNPFPGPSSMVISKRKLDTDNEYSPENRVSKKQKPMRVEISPSCLLNEIFPGLNYDYSNQLGLPHEPMFEVSVVLPSNSTPYHGCGRSKKLAKQNLAEIILKDIGYALPSASTGNVGQNEIIPLEVFKRQHLRESITSVDTEMIECLDDSPVHSMQIQQEPDFTSDDLADLAVSGYPQPLMEALQPTAAPPVTHRQNVLKKLLKIDFNEQPSCALHSILGPGDAVRYEFLPVNSLLPQHAQIFQVKLFCTTKSFITTKQVDNTEQVFIGEGQSKKQAKAHAARLALMSILGAEYFEYLSNLNRNRNETVNPSLAKPILPCHKAMPVSHRLSPPQEMENDPEAEDYSLSFSQHVKKIITEKHAELVHDNQSYATQKVIAGIVMTLRSPLVENSHVIAVTTGTKCINGDFMSDKGLALNDCHAEVLATRCLRDFLYSQIDALVTSSTESADEREATRNRVVLEQEPSTAEGVLRFNLKTGVKFHLYISTSPCGDARIFSPKGLELSPEEELMESSSSCAPGEEVADAHPNKINRGLLRAKIEAGEGTIPVANLIDSGILQTWDGIMLGNALKTMSCSDKICKWNVIGVQGALLSIFMDPIYYSSIILGSLHHPVHLKRAVYSRVETIPTLPSPYRLNKPRLVMVADKGKRRVAKSPNHSVIWTCSWNALEIVSSSKGRCEPAGVTSRLCKRLAFMRFLKLYKNETGRMDNYARISYEAAKNLATNYQISKKQLISFMEESGYGGWIAKPVEQDAFQI